MHDLSGQTERDALFEGVFRFFRTVVSIPQGRESRNWAGFTLIGQESAIEVLRFRREFAHILYVQP
jgi:hypothetical protein